MVLQTPRRRHRGIQWMGVGLSVLFLGSLIVAVLSVRHLQGSIPGSDSILSLAVIHQGFLVGTTGGVLASPDGRTWLPATNIPREPVGVASDGTTSYVLAGGVLKSTGDLHAFTTLATGVTGTVMAPGPSGSVDVVAGRTVERILGPAALPPLARVPLSPVFAVAVDGGSADSVLVAGIAGLWRTDDAGATWQRLLGTPTQAVLIDPANSQRILLGTPGGMLESLNGGLSWRQTELRSDIHGLSWGRGKFFAVTTERVVYGSNDGATGWRAFTG